MRHWLKGANALRVTKARPRSAGGAGYRGHALAFPVSCCALVGRRFGGSAHRGEREHALLLPHLTSRGVQVLVVRKSHDWPRTHPR